LYTTCSPHVLQKEELLTKIYLYVIYKELLKALAACGNKNNQKETS
jgi:hypothetical protein